MTNMHSISHNFLWSIILIFKQVFLWQDYFCALWPAPFPYVSSKALMHLAQLVDMAVTWMSLWTRVTWHLLRGQPKLNQSRFSQVLKVGVQQCWVYILAAAHCRELELHSKNDLQTSVYYYFLYHKLKFVKYCQAIYKCKIKIIKWIISLLLYYPLQNLLMIHLQHFARAGEWI